MNVDNGRRLPLVVDGVFEGLAGVSRGAVAFVPNRSGKQAKDALGGTLDGKPIQLLNIKPLKDGRTFTANYAEVS